MKVDRSKALQAEHGGRTYYFCSEHCRSEFLADPDSRVGKAPPADEHAMGHAH
jgi:Cu+-exporting ATPase